MIISLPISVIQHPDLSFFFFGLLQTLLSIFLLENIFRATSYLQGEVDWLTLLYAHVACYVVVKRPWRTTFDFRSLPVSPDLRNHYRFCCILYYIERWLNMQLAMVTESTHAQAI